MADGRPVYFWVMGYRDVRGLRLIEAEEFGDRSSCDYSEPAAWYAHRGGRTHYLDADALGHIHMYGLGWDWAVNPAAKYPPPPFLLTDDPHLFPAYEGAVGIRPTGEVNGWLTEGLGRDSTPFVAPVVGSGWLGVLSVSRGGFASGRGDLIAFSATGEVPQGACEGVMMPHYEEQFGTIEFPRKGSTQ